MTSQMKAGDAKLDNIKKKCATKRAERDAIEVDLNKCASIKSAYQAFQQKRDDIQKMAEEIAAEEDDLEKLKETLEEKTVAAARIRDDKCRRVEDLKTSIEALLNLCEANDQQAKAARDKRSRVEKKKVKLLTKLKKLEAEIEKGCHDTQAKLTSLKKENESLETLVTNLESAVESKKKNREELKSQRAKYRSEADGKFEELEKRAANLKKATDLERDGEPLFRLSVLQEAAKLLEAAKEFGHFDFSG
jgi:chromosome segregation ATPase